MIKFLWLLLWVTIGHPSVVSKIIIYKWKKKKKKKKNKNKIKSSSTEDSICLRILYGKLHSDWPRDFDCTYLPGGGTQLWVGYGCAARSFDHYPITKPEKTQICYLYLNHSFLEGPFLKPISAFHNVNWDA